MQSAYPTFKAEREIFKGEREILTDLWMHQNSLMWDRLNTLGVLQIAVWS
jgi:hypothetical protein